MLGFIWAIPEWIGWIIVGVLGLACLLTVVKLGKFIIQIWKEWHEEEEN